MIFFFTLFCFCTLFKLFLPGVHRLYRILKNDAYTEILCPKLRRGCFLKLMATKLLFLFTNTHNGVLSARAPRKWSELAFSARKTLGFPPSIVALEAVRNVYFCLFEILRNCNDFSFLVWFNWVMIFQKFPEKSL